MKKKHLIKLIEEYLQNEDDIITKKKLQNIKDYHHKLGFTNSIVHELSIRKNLKILKEGLNQKTNKEWYKYSRMTYTEYEVYCNYKQ
jgi:hypothetical protein